MLLPRPYVLRTAWRTLVQPHPWEEQRLLGMLSSKTARHNIEPSRSCPTYLTIPETSVAPLTVVDSSMSLIGFVVDQMRMSARRRRKVDQSKRLLRSFWVTIVEILMFKGNSLNIEIWRTVRGRLRRSWPGQSVLHNGSSKRGLP